MADQVEEEERSSDVEDEKSIPNRPGAREVIEELRHHLAHTATGPAPVSRVRALCPVRAVTVMGWFSLSNKAPS